MKKLLLLTTISAIAALNANALPAKDSNRFFVKAFGGYSFAPSNAGYNYNADTTQRLFSVSNGGKDGLVYGGAFGYYIGNGLTTSLEYYAHGNLKEKDSSAGFDTTMGASVKAGFLNFGYELANSTMLTPYVFVGGGMAKVNPLLADESNKLNIKSKSVGAYQLGIGGKIDVTSNLALDLGARYVGFASKAFKPGANPNYSNIKFKKGNEAVLTAGIIVSF